MGSSRVRVAVAALGLMAPILGAQDRSKEAKGGSVPESAMPPAGMCRLWLPDVPERQQPAPTDCATAIRTMPRDAMVLFGDLKRGAKQAGPAGAAAAARQQAVARDIPPFRGPIPAGGVQAQRLMPGAQVAPGSQAAARTAPAGTAAATKAPDTKAAVVKPPENRQ